MTTVEVKRPISLGLGASSRVLKVGVHSLTDKEMGMWFMKGLIASGAVVVRKQEFPTAASEQQPGVQKSGKHERLKYEIPHVVFHSSNVATEVGRASDNVKEEKSEVVAPVVDEKPAQDVQQEVKEPESGNAEEKKSEVVAPVTTRRRRSA
jgi:hypothetical protein